MTKNSSAASSWQMYDTNRLGYNIYNYRLLADSSSAELSGIASSDPILDILSNGFKLRNTDQANNGNGNTIIYMAFAENPFKYSLAR
jgi:hypothetical protein